MNLNVLRRHRKAAGLRVVTFNCWVGQEPKQLRENLLKLVRDTNKPHIIIVQEAWRWDAGTIRGYNTVRPDQNQYDTDKSTIILVRQDAKIHHVGARRVPDGNWIWNGNQKAPRVYPRVTVSFKELGATVFDVIGVHRIPNGPAPSIPLNRAGWEAEHRLLVEWVERIHKAHPNRVIVLGGDWNARLGESPQAPFSLLSLAKKMDTRADIVLRGIDGFIVINGEARETEELEHKYGSDGHHPVVTTIKSTLKEAA